MDETSDDCVQNKTNNLQEKENKKITNKISFCGRFKCQQNKSCISFFQSGSKNVSIH